MTPTTRISTKTIAGRRVAYVSVMHALGTKAAVRIAVAALVAKGMTPLTSTDPETALMVDGEWYDGSFQSAQRRGAADTVILALRPALPKPTPTTFKGTGLSLCLMGETVPVYVLDASGNPVPATYLQHVYEGDKMVGLVLRAVAP